MYESNTFEGKDPIWALPHAGYTQQQHRMNAVMSPSLQLLYMFYIQLASSFINYSPITPTSGYLYLILFLLQKFNILPNEIAHSLLKWDTLPPKCLLRS